METDNTFNYKQSDSFYKAYKAYLWLCDTKYMIAYNKIGGLYVFNRRGQYRKSVKVESYNTYQPTKTKYIKNDVYNILGPAVKKDTKRNLVVRHYSTWQLISLCLAFGQYNEDTNDYVICGKKNG